MKKHLAAIVALGFLGTLAGAKPNDDRPQLDITPAALQAEIEAMRPDRHVWRQLPWKTCPLDALQESMQQNKPVIVWVFLGLPTDERC